jgi:hypothetical protein
MPKARPATLSASWPVSLETRKSFLVFSQKNQRKTTKKEAKNFYLSGARLALRLTPVATAHAPDHSLPGDDPPVPKYPRTGG